MIDWIKRNKITVAFVGGAIVIGSQWATCSIEPNVVPPEDTPEEVEGE
tara:strand:+ start:3721 stop:3864 length:144 start_codon:yes stop_codon:yes gene_type:complete